MDEAQDFDHPVGCDTIHDDMARAVHARLGSYEAARKARVEASNAMYLRNLARTRYVRAIAHRLKGSKDQTVVTFAASSPRFQAPPGELPRCVPLRG